MSELARFRRFYELLGFTLEPFQELIAAEVFSERRECLCLLPRRNGKSTLLAWPGRSPYYNPPSHLGAGTGAHTAGGRAGD
jgi:hypothetical protein